MRAVYPETWPNVKHKMKARADEIFRQNRKSVQVLGINQAILHTGNAQQARQVFIGLFLYHSL